MTEEIEGYYEEKDEIKCQALEEGKLSRLRSGGTPASLLSSRHLSCRMCMYIYIRGPGLLARPKTNPGNEPSSAASWPFATPSS